MENAAKKGANLVQVRVRIYSWRMGLCIVALLIEETTNQAEITTNQLKCWFSVRGENRSTRGETSQSRVETQQIQPTYDGGSGNGTQATLVGGKCSHHSTKSALKHRHE